jgi:hypothetical protein
MIANLRTARGKERKSASQANRPVRLGVDGIARGTVYAVSKVAEERVLQASRRLAQGSAGEGS